MQRNYEKENARQKELNTIFKVKISNEIAKEFKEKLEKNKLSYSEFARKNIENFLKNTWQRVHDML